ncbi:hypothetical protein L3Y34_010474 [Caenorhabditis briggsae]|uniref:Neurotransmitter-gated ion-channel ligand-binding domain-containing protein n=1 Tax=Caenorhabditis briggsae TaxID=6238 RepID=A0AAE9CT48_CAEBR|nr:hypothetical protein L3Y34_010474 [Caenorhabditis briggsae]
MFFLTISILVCFHEINGFYYNPDFYVPKWKEFLEHQENLTETLFKNYDPGISPIYTIFDRFKPIGYDPEGPSRWNYSVFLYYLKLVEVQEPQEKVSVVLEIMEGWFDPRLSWDPASHGNISSIYTRQDKIWSPTLTSFGVDDIIDFRDPDFRIANVDFAGTISNYVSAVFEITIRRNPLYYIYMIVFPSFIINVISIIGVFLKNADKMSKLNVGLTNIMTMTFILGVMADKIPRTGIIPLLGIYIIINLVIMVLAIAVVTVITEFREWAVPRLKLKRGSVSRKLEIFLGSPLEYTCAILLELLTTANFFVMIGFWFEDL